MYKLIEIDERIIYNGCSAIIIENICLALPTPFFSTVAIFTVFQHNNQLHAWNTSIKFQKQIHLEISVWFPILLSIMLYRLVAYKHPSASF